MESGCLPNREKGNTGQGLSEFSREEVLTESLWLLTLADRVLCSSFLSHFLLEPVPFSGGKSRVPGSRGLSRFETLFQGAVSSDHSHSTCSPGPLCLDLGVDLERPLTSLFRSLILLFSYGGAGPCLY